MIAKCDRCGEVFVIDQSHREYEIIRIRPDPLGFCGHQNYIHLCQLCYKDFISFMNSKSK